MSVASAVKPKEQARDGFGRLLRAEWTKFRTVRGWPVGMALGALFIVLMGVLFAANSYSSCMNDGKEVACEPPPIGPGGEAVDDKFYFLHQTLAGDGSITARVSKMSGIRTYPPPDHDKIVPGMVPWAKAGVMVKENTRQGSAYAAMMLTAQHGVRMQYNFTGDIAGSPGPAPRWLRLTRTGRTLTGYESTDGRQWRTVGTTQLSGLGSSVQVGLFAASPSDLTVKSADIGGIISTARLAKVTGIFDNIGLQGSTPEGAWKRTDVGASPGPVSGIHHPGSAHQTGGSFVLTGNGDIAPMGTVGGLTLQNLLTGVVLALLAVIIVGAVFVTAEYRRGLIRTTLLASPRRGRALAAKAVVIGGVTFAVMLVALVATVLVARPMLLANKNFIMPVSLLTDVRVVVGTAGLLAVAAVLALGLGVVFRRSAAAVITAFAVIVVPYVLATTSLLPQGAAEWLLRVTPAAAFAVQQSIPAYPQVLSSGLPQEGYFPLPPWAGFAVLCAYAALVLGLAARRLRRRDA